MAFQPAPTCAQVTLRFVDSTDGTFIGENTLNFRNQAGVAFVLSELQLLVTTIADWWSTTLSPITSIDATLASISARALDSEEAPYWEVTIGDDGTQVGDRVSANVTLSVSFRTGLTGRSARGRAYMVGMAETQVSGNQVTPAYAGAVVAAWEALGAAVSGEGFDHVVLSRFTGGAARPVASPRIITSYTLTDNRVDTQRDRLNG